VARYLNQSRAARHTKQATWVVVSVNPDDVPSLLPAIFLFSKRLKVQKTTQANRYTQCTNCYRFGHASARCTQKHPTCPYCALHHTRSAHRCLNPTCPKGGDSKAVSGCCATSPPHCPHCGDDHDAVSRECRARPVPPPQPEARPPSDEELSDASSDSEEAMDVGDDGRPAPPTPEAPSAQTIDLSTPDYSSSPETPPPPPQWAPASTHWPGPAASNLFETLGLVLEMIEKLHSTLRHGLAPATNRPLVQHNSLGSWDVFLSLSSSLVEGPPTDVVLLQDPASSKGFLPSLSGIKSLAPPVARPIVACYVSLNFLRKFAALSFFPPETDDFMALDVSTPQACFGINFPHFRVGNAYGSPLSPHPDSVSPESAFWDPDYPSLVAGDFNIHNATTDLSRLLSANEENESAPYFDRATDLGLTLLYIPGVYTRFPFTGTHRASAIDLPFANPHMFPAFRSWDGSSLPFTGSDHVPILILVRPPSPHSDKLRPRGQEADWPGLENRVKNWLVPPAPDAPSPNQLDQWVSSALSALTTIIEKDTPRSRPSTKSKAGWTPLLTTLRKEFTQVTPRAKKLRTPDSYTVARLSKLGYFKAIRRAKASYSADFLAKTTPNNIWKAKQLVAPRKTPRFPSLPDASDPVAINNALLNHFVPPKDPLPSRGRVTKNLSATPLT